MLLMKEGDPATHARIHFLMDHTQVFVVFSFFSSQMTNCPFLGEGRETVTAAVANGIDELLNKGSQSLLDHVNCQNFLSLSLDHPLRIISSQVIPHRRNHVTVSFHLSHVILSYVIHHMSFITHPHPVGRKEWLQQARCGTVHRFCFVLSQLIFKVVFLACINIM